MAYERQPHPRRWEFLYGGNGPQTVIRYEFVLDNTETRPTSATIAIDNSGGTALLAATAMTLEASPSATFTYTIDASDTDDYPLGEGYKATIATTYSSKVYTDAVWFDIVRRPLIPTLDDEGLYEAEQELRLYKDDGETDWSKKIFLAWCKLDNRLRQKVAQDKKLRPALIVGYNQIMEAHRAWALELVFFDRTGEGSGNLIKYEKYHTERVEELEAALSTLVYAAGDPEDPGVTETENFAGITLKR